MALRLGLFVNPSAGSLDDTHQMVATAERGGLDLIGIQDHPYQRRFLETFALIGYLLARTERLTFFPAVANLPLRYPTMLSKQSASLDVLSGGRFELGLGAGGFYDRITTMGGPLLEPKTSVSALEEAIPIIRSGWSGQETVSHHGKHYNFDGWEPGPPPTHPIGIWLGAYKPRMLRITGRLADGWMPSLFGMGPDDLVEARKVVDQAADKAGRDPSEVLGIYNVTGEVTDGELGDGPLDGPPGRWVEALADWVGRARLGAVIFPAKSVDQVERLVNEVAPPLREAVA
jgi:alkanesulfonate monooxygenase SsuD/methylene tetrahydromethanopterin reductase-like flavin-dependent oxidoreductase (luciferase family)